MYVYLYLYFSFLLKPTETSLLPDHNSVIILKHRCKRIP